MFAINSLVKMKHFWLFTLSIILAIGAMKTASGTPKIGENNVAHIPCVYVPGLYLGSRLRELECCNATEKTFVKNTLKKRAYLTRYLATVKDWDCPQFADECQYRSFDYNNFTSNIYDYFCNPNLFEKRCFGPLSQLVKSKIELSKEILSDQSNNSASLPKSNWTTLLRYVENQRFSVSNLTDPCLQAALYQIGDRTKYQEIKTFEIPMCNMVWAGFDERTIKKNQISLWILLPHRCRIAYSVISVVCAILGLLITCLNAAVLLAFKNTPALRNSQGVYKISLAFADLLVGCVLFPTFLVSLWLATHQTLSPYETGLPSAISGNLSNATLGVFKSAVPYESVLAFPKAYLDFVGFVTSLSLAASVYTLAVAGVDRLVAVYRPLRYRKHKAKKLASIISVFIWAAAGGFASLPLFVPNLKYRMAASFFVSLAGRTSLLIYAVAFAFPLVVTWALSISTYVAFFRHRRGVTSRRLSSTNMSKVNSVEHRLAKTLVLMVGCFSVSVVPVFVVLIASRFIPNIYPDVPRLFDPDFNSIIIGIDLFVFLLVACNSLWNFFIYNARHDDFRKALKDIIKKTGALNCRRSCYVSCLNLANRGRRRLSSIHINLSGDPKKSDQSERSSSLDFDRKHTRELKLSSTTETNDVFNSSPLRFKKKKRMAGWKGGRREIGEESNTFFQSFVVDANVDGFFNSVMANLPDEDNSFERKATKV